MSDPQTQPSATLSGDVRIPMVGFGTWQVFGPEAYEATRHALEAGYRHIDTATAYRNEAEIGRALRDSGLAREEVFVTTKLPPAAAGRERETIEASLRALDLDFVDLWLVHWPPADRARPDTWEAFLAARERGQTRAVGVSNYDVAQLDELARATGEQPALNQIKWSPRLHHGDVLTQHRERGVVVEGYSPLRASDLDDPVLAEVATAHGVSPAQVVLRWHLEHDIVVIPKSATPEHIVENLDVFSFTLTPEETARIDALSRAG